MYVILIKNIETYSFTVCKTKVCHTNCERVCFDIVYHISLTMTLSIDYKHEISTTPTVTVIIYKSIHELYSKSLIFGT